MKRAAKPPLANSAGKDVRRKQVDKLPATHVADPEGPRLIPLSPAPPEEPIDTNAASGWISLAAEALSVWERAEKTADLKYKTAKSGK